MPAEAHAPGKAPRPLKFNMNLFGFKVSRYRAVMHCRVSNRI